MPTAFRLLPGNDLVALEQHSGGKGNFTSVEAPVDPQIVMRMQEAVETMRIRQEAENTRREQVAIELGHLSTEQQNAEASL